MGIYEPNDLQEREIARKLNIFLTYTDHRSYSTQEGNFKLINIHKQMDKMTQREIFYHELCHLLRHEGYQYKLMPIPFRELQEWDAGHFTRYAAIPFHMLGYVDWKSPTLVRDMSNVFKISEDICEYRINHVRRNMTQKQII